MSIYMKGIKMPINCESCPCKTAEAFGGLGCQATGYIPLRKADQDRPDNCPLIYVPPHGSLIEKHDVFKLITAFPEVDKLLPVKFMEALYNLPTIIPAEEGE